MKPNGNFHCFIVLYLFFSILNKTQKVLNMIRVMIMPLLQSYKPLILGKIAVDFISVCAKFIKNRIPIIFDLILPFCDCEIFYFPHNVFLLYYLLPPPEFGCGVFSVPNKKWKRLII